MQFCHFLQSKKLGAAEGSTVFDRYARGSSARSPTAHARAESVPSPAAAARSRRPHRPRESLVACAPDPIADVASGG